MVESVDRRRAGRRHGNWRGRRAVCQCPNTAGHETDPRAGHAAHIAQRALGPSCSPFASDQCAGVAPDHRRADGPSRRRSLHQGWGSLAEGQGPRSSEREKGLDRAAGNRGVDDELASRRQHVQSSRSRVQAGPSGAFLRGGRGQAFDADSARKVLRRRNRTHAACQGRGAVRPRVERPLQRAAGVRGRSRPDRHTRRREPRRHARDGGLPWLRAPPQSKHSLAGRAYQTGCTGGHHTLSRARGSACSETARSAASSTSA